MTRDARGRGPQKKQVLVPDEPFEFDLRTHDEDGVLGTELEEGSRERIMTAVFQALGAASVCWTERPSGVFMSQRAEQIGMALLQEIEDYRTVGQFD